VDALAATTAIPRAVSPWRTELDRRSANPTVRKAMVVMCHVTWIMLSQSGSDAFEPVIPGTEVRDFRPLIEDRA